MTDNELLVLINQWLTDLFNQSSTQNSTVNSQVDVQNSVIEVQNSTLNSQIEVLNSTMSSQIEVQNSKDEVQGSIIEVQNSTLNSQIEVFNSQINSINSEIATQFITENSYNQQSVINDQTFNSSLGYNMNLLQYQQNKQIEFKSYDFIFFAIIISALLVVIIVKGLKRV